MIIIHHDFLTPNKARMYSKCIDKCTKYLLKQKSSEPHVKE